MTYFDEALRDHVSTMMSWDAMGAYLQFFPAEFKEYLPTKSFHSYEKTFFISRAYMQCQASNAFYWADWFTQPPGFHLVNRGLSNFQPFRRSFKCGENDEMVSEPRCQVFPHEDGLFYGLEK